MRKFVQISLILLLLSSLCLTSIASPTLAQNGQKPDLVITNISVNGNAEKISLLCPLIAI